jgi:hypothetical protein
VLFRFRCAGVGAANLTFTTSWADGHGAADALLYPLPLLGLQAPVTVSTSFALEANHSKARWVEGLDFPPAVRGSGRVGVVAGVGRWPAIRQVGAAVDAAVDSAMRRLGWDFSDDLVASLVPPLAAAVYKQYNVSAHATLLRSFATLQSYTDRNGLEPMPPWKINYPTYPSVYPNFLGVYVWRQMQGAFHYPLLDLLLKNAAAKRTVAQWSAAIAEALLSAYDAAVRELEREHRRVARWVDWSWETVARARFALGPHWKPHAGPAAFQGNVSMAALKAQVPTLSMSAQAMVLLTMLDGAAPLVAADLALLKATAMHWYDSLRVQGETAYIEAAPGQPHAAALGANALALRVFVEAPSLKLATDPLVEKLANYVAGPALTGGSQQMWCALGRNTIVADRSAALRGGPG